MPDSREVAPERKQVQIPTPSALLELPENSKDIFFELKSVHISGATAFSSVQLENIYKKYLGQKLPLSTVWQIANDITTMYRNKGYFLSRAYVPAQEIDGGNIVINIVEGYIGDINFKDTPYIPTIFQSHVNRLMQAKPVRVEEVENFLLLLNDVPGYEFRAVLMKADTATVDEGATKLILLSQQDTYSATIGVDNYGSRFLGPYEMSASYSDSFLPGQRTNFSILSTLPTHELSYVSAEHSIYLLPDLSIGMNTSYSRARPGEFLSALEVESRSLYADTILTYQVIRQRDKNLSVDAGFKVRNSETEILDVSINRDRIRAFSANIYYDFTDTWNGLNFLNVGLTKGIDIFGSNRKNDPDATRAQAAPDFTKTNLSAVRVQGITDDINMVASVAGQAASRPLYSSEEFGYGGQRFGRAYDSSELTGDHGVEASLELRYQGLDTGDKIKFVPYAFYDIGKIWNEDRDEKPKSGSSAGFGMHIDTDLGFSGNIGIAFPLTRSVDNPIYKDDTHDPRLSFEIIKKF